MDEFTCIAYVPRRSEHYDAQCFMHMYENQDICGAITVIVVDDPTLERLYCVLPENLN